jgi:hypothetical protein
MTTKEQFYNCAGYYSLPFSAVPLAATTYLEFFGAVLPFLFGSVGFWFAVSGIWRGWGARLCALVSLLIFAHLGLVVFSHNARF